MAAELFQWENADLRERTTDVYLLVMLLVFPLFTGFRGYAAVTLSKFLLFSLATALWLLTLAVVSLRERLRFPRPDAAMLCALVFLALLGLSALLSPYRGAVLLGAGRYDGLLTWALYVLIFLGVSAFGRPKGVHALAFGVSVTLCCLVASLQLLGRDPLWLFPGELTYYDAHTYYTGEFLGTIGNADLLAAMLCLATPLFFTISVQGPAPWRALALIPFFCAVAILLASGVAGGILAAAGFALIAPPLLLTKRELVCRGLRAVAVCALAGALRAAFSASYEAGALRWRLAFTPVCGLCLALAAAFLAISLLCRVPKGFPSGRTLRRVFVGLSLAVTLAALAALWFWPGGEGSLYELSQAMRGHLEDGFGSSRVRIWRRCWALFRTRPVFGLGPGTLGLALDIRFSRFVEATGQTLVTYADNAHNLYLQLLTEGGVPALAAYLALLWNVLRRRRACGDGLWLAIVTYCIQACFGLELCLTAPLFWIALGLAAGAVRKNWRNP